jgi:exodeoxyribonuclease VII large subunit
VLTGIGHERDSTVLDEVANAKYDTPSKVIAGIEQVIVKRAAEAKAYFEQVTNRASMTVQSVKAKTFELDATVRSESTRHLAMGMQASQELINGIRLNAIQDIRTASEASLEALQGVKSGARQKMAQAKQDVPLYWGQVSLGVKHALRSASVEVDAMRDGVFERTQRDVARARVGADDTMLMVGTSAKRLVREAASSSEALMREIAGQGPEKTLSRGFALVRDQVGKPITRAQQTTNNAAIEIQFFDGKVAATIENQQ